MSRSQHCILGVGCDEAGVCYAAALGEPERCPRDSASRRNGEDSRSEAEAEGRQSGSAKTEHRPDSTSGPPNNKGGE